MNCEISYEELSAYDSGDLEPERMRHIKAHVRACVHCRAHLAALAEADKGLRALTAQQPLAHIAARAWETIAAEIGREHGHEIMTLEEVAAFLRAPLEDIEPLLGDLPSFEIAGHVRVRRARLLEWIEDRERRQARHITQSEMARALSAAWHRRPTALGVG